MSPPVRVLFVPLSPPKRPRGRPRNDGRKVAVRLAYAAHRWEGANRAAERVAAELGYATGREVRKVMEGAPGLLRDGIELAGECGAFWVSQDADFAWESAALTITGPTWQWEPGMREALHYPQGRLRLEFANEDLPAIRASIPFG